MSALVTVACSSSKDTPTVAGNQTNTTVAGTAKPTFAAGTTMAKLQAAGKITVGVKYDQPGGGAYDAAPQVLESVGARPQPCSVPNVVGKQLRQARQAIAKQHCRTGKVRSAYSKKRKKGIVVAQSRRPGKVLPTGSAIDLVVSRGRRP